MTVTSFSTLFSRALRGETCRVLGLGDPRPLPVGDWTRSADPTDGELLAHCVGATIDVGCGPGRLTEALAARGQLALGIDVVPEAVDQARGRGGSALHRDVFGSLPGEGRWRTALLADGNIGIGGDPVRLLTRLRELVDPRGRIVVEIAGPGVGVSSGWATLECAGDQSRPFRWSVVGVDGIDEVSHASGLGTPAVHRLGADRWCAVLEEIA